MCFAAQNPGRWTPVSGYETVGTLCEGSCEEHLIELEWALSGMWGTGAFPQLRSAGKLWDGPKSKTMLAKWISWCVVFWSFPTVFSPEPVLANAPHVF